MRSIFLLIILLAISFGSFAQSSNDSTPKIEGQFKLSKSWSFKIDSGKGSDSAYKLLVFTSNGSKIETGTIRLKKDGTADSAQLATLDSLIGIINPGLINYARGWDTLQSLKNQLKIGSPKGAKSNEGDQAAAPIKGSSVEPKKAWWEFVLDYIYTWQFLIYSLIILSLVLAVLYFRDKQRDLAHILANQPKIPERKSEDQAFLNSIPPSLFDLLNIKVNSLHTSDDFCREVNSFISQLKAKHNSENKQASEAQNEMQILISKLKAEIEEIITNSKKVQCELEEIIGQKEMVESTLRKERDDLEGHKLIAQKLIDQFLPGYSQLETLHGQADADRLCKKEIVSKLLLFALYSSSNFKELLGKASSSDMANVEFLKNGKAIHFEGTVNGESDLMKVNYFPYYLYQLIKDYDIPTLGNVSVNGLKIG